MVPLLHEVADNWRAQRLKGQVSRSLKLTLLQSQEMGWITSDMEYNFLDWNAEEQKLVPRQEGTLTQDQILADARRMKTILNTLRRGSQCSARLSVGNGHLCPGALPAVPGRGGGDGDLPEVVRVLRAPPSVATPQAGPPGAVAADQGDSGGGRLVNGVVPSPVCIPASLASLVLHNPDNLCYLNAAVFLLAYVSDNC